MKNDLGLTTDYKYRLLFHYLEDKVVIIPCIAISDRILQDLGCINEVSYLRVSEKGRGIIENLDIQELLRFNTKINSSIIITKKELKLKAFYELVYNSMNKLTKKELCIYLVHNNLTIREIAKKIYDEK